MEYIVQLDCGDYLQVTAVFPGILRFRLGGTKLFAPSSVEKFGILNTEFEPLTISSQEMGEEVIVSVGEIKISLNRSTAEITIPDHNNTVTRFMPCRAVGSCGNGLDISIEKEEKFYGLGYRHASHLQLRGESYRNHVAYGQSYGPIPFLMSSKGWAVYYNTTFDSYFDVGNTDKDKIHIWSEGKDFDIFIMLADSYKNLIGLFTKITGRPALMPLWGYGFMFICNEKENQFDILNDADKFMTNKIPCDMLGLEPSWMSEYYDESLEKDWDSEKFYMPWWDEDRSIFKDVTFIGALKRYGFKLSLWMCCDYDIYAEEMRQEKHREDTGAPYQKPYGFGKLDFDTKAHAPRYMDKFQKKDVSWFEHLKKFIDSGVEAFKQDPAYVVNDHPDRLYANGMTDEEAHNIYSTVLAKQVHEGHKAYTDKRSMYFLGTAYTGIQRWEPTWTCDSGGRDEVLLGVLQYGLCGHMNVTCDMDVHSADGIHFGFLLPWSLANSWASVEHPWWLGKDLYNIFVYYARLHYSLIPYIYSCAFEGYFSGMPIVRAMNLMYENDENCDDLLHQYMLGDYLLVGAFTDRIYLPEGEWFDYWTGESYNGKQTVEYACPKDRGGPLFVKAGAIIPRWRDDVLSAESQNNRDLIIEYYEGASGSFTLYEDDGISYGYEQSKYNRTDIEIRRTDNDRININLTQSNADYCGFDGKRSFCFVIKGDGTEKTVFFNGTRLGCALENESGAVNVSFEKRLINREAVS